MLEGSHSSVPISRAIPYIVTGGIFLGGAEDVSAAEVVVGGIYVDKNAPSALPFNSELL